jgi:hypothetical protein
MKRGRFHRIWFAVLLAGVVVLALSASAGGGGTGTVTIIRWDIVSIDFDAGTVSAGGKASARAADGSKITLTGSGRVRLERGEPPRVLPGGGGFWQVRDASGNVTGSGTYRTTKFVQWHKAPGTGPPLADRIGNPANRSAGLLILRIGYSDGTRGVLAVSCHLVGTPDTVFEGITATKGFASYTFPEAPAPPADGNFTLFHVRSR